MDLTEEPLATTSQDIVINIEPTSQHGARFDIVTVTTTAVVDDRVVQLSERHEVRPDGDEFQLAVAVPVRGTAVAKDKENLFRWSAFCLLPRPTPEYDVIVRSGGGDGIRDELALDAERPRQVIAWQGQLDDPLEVVWQYVRGR